MAGVDMLVSAVRYAMACWNERDTDAMPNPAGPPATPHPARLRVGVIGAGRVGATLGAALARHWDLPEHIIAAVHYHHQPGNKHAADGQPLAAIANLAERLLPAFGVNEQVTCEIADQEWQSLGIDAAAAGEIVAEAQEHAMEVAASFD